ncbi:unnamed protein product, partial [Nesidiocoris tenuis]
MSLRFGFIVFDYEFEFLFHCEFEEFTFSSRFNSVYQLLENLPITRSRQNLSNLAFGGLQHNYKIRDLAKPFEFEILSSLSEYFDPSPCLVLYYLLHHTVEPSPA